MYRSLLEDAYNSLGRLLPLLAILMLVASFLEGLGLTMLLPLLSRFGLDGDNNGFLAQQIDATLGWFAIPPTLGALMVVIVVIQLFQTGMTLAVRILQSKLSTRYTADWRNRLFRAVMQARWSYFQDTKVETHTNQIMQETARNSAALSLLLQLVNSIFFIIIYALIACLTAWQVVIGLSLFGAILYWLTRPISNRSRKVGIEVTTVSETLFGRTQEFLLNAKLIKSTATEKVAQKIIEEDIDAYRKTYFEAGVIPALIQAIYMGSGYIFLGFSVWVTITWLNVSPAATIVTIYIFLRLYTQIANMQQLQQSFLLSAPALANCQKELDIAGKQREQAGTGKTGLATEGAVKIDIKDLSINYGKHKALKSVSLHIPAGGVLGLTGPSGAGKSTMIDAIVGLVLPDGGQVRIDGHAITSLSPQDWRRHIGYVAQETLVIKGTVAENIAWGKAGATREEVISAARRANAHDFIADMPEGYETVIGGRSMRMSGGQRQRIGLARALLGAKRLLLLDEATSSLDSGSEQKVLEAVENLKGQVTIIMVAHRLSTLKFADELVVFEQGNIIERGSFDSLSSAGGAFGRLWEIQSSSTPSRKASS